MEDMKNKQGLAIAYNVKRHAMRKKMAQGGPVQGTTVPDVTKINYPKGASLAHGGHVHDDMCMSKGGACYAEGGMVENEMLDPMNEPEHGAERVMQKEHDFGFKGQNYEDLSHPEEPDLSVGVDEENTPHHMFAKGGIAKAIMMKHMKSMPMMAKGGRIEEGESIDNQYPDEHPDNDYLSDEEDTPYFNYSDMDTFDPTEKRRAQIGKIMRGLHERNR